MDNIQEQINALDSKMDLLLDYVRDQKLKSEAIEDLISDFTIIGKDVYDSTVEELDNRQVELEPSELTELGVSLLRNIKNFISIVDTLESVMDLTTEIGPIANEVIIDVSKKLGEFEQKGYFDFLRESMGVIDNIILAFPPEDIKLLADNIVGIMNVIKQVSQPEVMNPISSTLIAFREVQEEEIPEYSIMKMLREMNSPEMKKAFGFIINLTKKIAKNNN